MPVATSSFFVEHLQSWQPETSRRVCRERDIAWLVLPFHPLWSRTITRAVASFNDSEFFSQILARDLRPLRQIRVAWRNVLPSLQQIMQADRLRKTRGLSMEVGWDGGGA